MTPAQIQNKLFELQDKEYAIFQSNLTPTIDKDLFIGVRVPVIRKLAKEIIKAGDYDEFLNSLPHQYYDENMLQSSLLSEIKDYQKVIEEVDKFLPYVDNWAVCDTLRPKIFNKNKDILISKIKDWSASKQVYISRFGMEILMNLYLDEDFKEEYLEIPANVHSEEYYLRMMQAWFYATALAKQWEATIPYITENRLDTWVHNKTIQKAKESYRITDEQKKYLTTLKR